MKKALILGIAGSFFFAFTFILNRSMHLSGGSWVWSASLRYIFSAPILAFIVWKKYGFSLIHAEIKKHWKSWIIWSTVGFGFFYTPLSFAGDYGESWLIAATWQITIVMGVLLTPLFGKKIPIKNLLASGIILGGVFLLQLHNLRNCELQTTALTLLPILAAAVSYPLGNRKMMQLCDDNLSTIERVYGMTLCSMPFWCIVAIYGYTKLGIPSEFQIIQSLSVALFSGIIATLLFFQATAYVKSNSKQLAVIESTQAGEVIFTLLGGIVFLGDSIPTLEGFIGILFIIVGMISNSLFSRES
ncbi:MAG: multidrug resistance efflux transporter family protein [Lachnotalea sp.]